MAEVRQALLRKGYIIIVTSGGDAVTQAVTTSKEALPWFWDEIDAGKMRNQERYLLLDLMCMLLKTWKMFNLNTVKEFKRLFVPKALDESKDYLVFDKLYALIGTDIVSFREKLMKKKTCRTLKEVIRKLIPPKDARRKRNDEGIEIVKKKK